jgi:hypothetical protein
LRFITSQYGGSIATQQNKDGHLIPLQATFCVQLNNCLAGDEKKSLLQELAGTASLQGERKIFIAKAFNKTIAAWNSEAGF